MSLMKIAIIDYNIGNLASVQNAFEVLKLKVNGRSIEIQIENKAENIKLYDKLILPGVGAFGDAIKNLQNTQMKEALNEFIKSGKFILGICLGMQLLFEKSYEFGEHEGLGLLKGEVVKFQTNPHIKIPHIGWNQCHLTPNAQSHPLLNDIEDKTYLYFVHSYHAICKNPKDLIANCSYGYEFPAIVAKDNILGIQAHPEKSHHKGLKILKNFSLL